jgi:hypothetical protein
MPPLVSFNPLLAGIPAPLTDPLSTIRTAEHVPRNNCASDRPDGYHGKLGEWIRRTLIRNQPAPLQDDREPLKR